MNEDRDFLRPSEVAPRLGLSVARIYQLIQEGQLPATRVAGALRIPVAAWAAWLEAHRDRALATLRTEE